MENILCGGEEERRNKRRKIFGKGKYFVCMKKNGEGKGEKYLKKENMFVGRRRKGRKMNGEGKYFFVE